VPLAVAVSGGPDSMALAWLLRARAGLVALTVDHGLRPEAADEAARVGTWLAPWGVAHHVLTAHTPPPRTGVQAWARDLRYRLMADFCARAGIAHLATAHHADDQAETLAHRLAKGSGLDGLVGIRPVQDLNGLTLIRPLLGAGKADLAALCAREGIPHVADPSNRNTDFARVRLRRALQAEGGTSGRLARTAARLARAADALEAWTDTEWAARALEGGGRITLRLDGAHPEIALRLLRRAAQALAPSAYGPKLERLEALAADLAAPGPFRRRTLGGVVFARGPDGAAILARE
jgi:tRNA(Ile)-lysidine synthase